jgi:hypothetical protein
VHVWRCVDAVNIQDSITYSPLQSIIVIICTTRSNTQKFYVVTTACIYVICMILRTVIISTYSTGLLSPLCSSQVRGICGWQRAMKHVSLRVQYLGFCAVSIIPPSSHAHPSPMIHTLCNWQRRLITHIHWTCCFSGAFAKLRKTTISFVMSVRPSDRPQGTTRFPLDGFSWNFIFEHFSKICRENVSFIQIWQE